MSNLQDAIEKYRESTSSFMGRVDAVRDAGEDGSQEAVAFLKEALQDKERLVQREVVKALSKVDSPETTSMLIDVLKSDDDSLQQYAAESLGDMGAVDAKSALQEVADNSDSLFAKSVAKRALEKIGWTERSHAGSSVTETTTETPVVTTTKASSDKTGDIVALLRSAVGGTNHKLTIDPRGLKHRIDVPLSDGRKQTVFVLSTGKDSDGAALICAYTVCAPATPENYELALRYNMKMAYGALAINEHSGDKMFVMVDPMLASTTDVVELRKSIASLARHGDRVEKDLTGLDVY